MHAHLNYSYGKTKTYIPSNKYPPLQIDAPNMCLYVAHNDNILAPMYTVCLRLACQLNLR